MEGIYFIIFINGQSSELFLLKNTKDLFDTMCQFLKLLEFR